MKKLFSSAVIASLVFGGFAPSFAQEKKDEKKPSVEELFKRLDKNGDSKLSKEEYVGKREADKKTKAEEAFAKAKADMDAANKAAARGSAPRMRRCAAADDVMSNHRPTGICSALASKAQPLPQPAMRAAFTSSLRMLIERSMSRPPVTANDARTKCTVIAGTSPCSSNLRNVGESITRSFSRTL